MELYQLRSFVAIAEEGNLTRAAERLFTSQPAVSAHIKALEEELGVQLFERKPQGMTLTPKGGLLLKTARATLDAAAGLKNQALSLKGEIAGDLNIGVHTDFDFVRVGQLHQSLTDAHPRVVPHFVQSMTAHILDDVRRGALDGGFFFGPCSSAEVSVYWLAQVPMRVVGPAAWQADIAEAGIASLADLPWIYTNKDCPFFALTEQLFHDGGVEPRKVAWVDSEDAVREFVRSGTGLSMLRADDAARLVDNGDACLWRGAVPELPLGFAVARQRAGEPVIRALRDAVGAIWPATGGDVPAADEA